MIQRYPKQEGCLAWDPVDPLGPSVDPRRYVPLETFERALASLARAIGEGRSPLLLGGAGGVGKTTLLRVLAERERWSALRVVFSPFLHLPADDVARWLLHLLDQPVPVGRSADDVLLEDVRARDGRRTVVLIDEIQCTPSASVQRLAALADDGRPHLVLVAAGTTGPALGAMADALGVELRVTLPDRLPATEMKALCDALLADPELPEALQALSPASREAILREAGGVPALLTGELVRRAYDAGAYADRRAAVAAEARAPLRAVQPAPGESLAEGRPSAAARSLRSYVAIDADPADADEIDLSQWVARHEPRPAPVAPWPRRALACAGRAPARAAQGCRDASRAASSAVAAGAATLASAAVADLRAQAAAMIAIASDVASALRRVASTLRPLAAALAGGVVALRAAATPLPAAAGSALAARARTAAARVCAASRAAWCAASTRAAATRGATVSALRGAQARLPAPLPAAFAVGTVLAVGMLALPAERDADASGGGRAAAPPAAAPRAGGPAPAAVASAGRLWAAEPNAHPSVRVQVNARPWARIRVDGVDVGPTPLGHVHLRPGPHEFEAAFPDGRRVLRVVEIGAAHRFVSLP